MHLPLVDVEGYVSSLVSTVPSAELVAYIPLDPTDTPRPRLKPDIQPPDLEGGEVGGGGILSPHISVGLGAVLMSVYIQLE